MLWPADLEALLAVCMVQAGFEVFAYCNNCLFLERCNLRLQSFNPRRRQLFPVAMPRPFAVGVLTGRPIVPMQPAVTVPTFDRRSGLQKVRAVRDCRTGAKCRRDVNRFR